MEIARSFNPSTPLGGRRPVLLRRAAKRRRPLTLVIRGNYQLITNLICYTATLVPAEWAAHVTTYCSLLVALWCVILFSRFSVESGWPLARSAMIVAILALLAQGYEVYLSSTNTQWLCALSLLFICVGQRRTSRGLSRALLYAWVAVCAFSGVPSSVMTPMFLVREPSSDRRSISAWDSCLLPAPQSRRSSSFCIRTLIDHFLRQCC